MITIRQPTFEEFTCLVPLLHTWGGDDLTLHDWAVPKQMLIGINGDNKILGIVGWSEVRDGYWLHVHPFAVAPEQRGRSLPFRLWKAMSREVDGFTLVATIEKQNTRVLKMAKAYGCNP